MHDCSKKAFFLMGGRCPGDLVVNPTEDCGDDGCDADRCCGNRLEIKCGGTREAMECSKCVRWL